MPRGRLAAPVGAPKVINGAKWITLRDATVLANRSRATIQRWIDAKYVPAILIERVTWLPVSELLECEKDRQIAMLKALGD